MGQNIAEQARMLPAETPSPSYAEPLWRRIADGPQAPTRRVTGGSDPSSPACVASGDTALLQPASPADPCQGPLEELPTGIWSGGIGDAVPRLSADGRKVVFISNAKLLVRGSNFGLAEGAPSDLYIADMHDGLTRVQALRALTEFASGNTQDLAEDAPVVDLAISPDGSQVAFTTMRTAFPLGSPAYVTLPAAVPGMLELFDVDLANDTLTRVTHGFEGGASAQPHREAGAETDPYLATGVESGALSPSFSGDGDTLAFSSTASNLVFGDGNTPQIEGSTTFDGSDAFVVSRVIFGSTPTPQDVSSPPANPSVAPVWDLGVTADSLGDGSVELEVEVPGAGSLSATAQSAAMVTSGRSSRASRRARHGPARGGHASTAVVNRAVAKSATHASAGGLVALTLTLAPRYRKFAGEPGGLSGTVSLAFTAAGHQTLRQSIEVIFVRTARRTAGRRAVSTHRRGAPRGHRR
jgi:hypothetical protein